MTPALAALVARAQELDAKASKGPWRVAASEEDGRCWWHETNHLCIVGAGPIEEASPVCATSDDIVPTQGDIWNAEFIVEARTLLPQLAAALASQGEEIARLKEAVQAERDRAQWIISFAAEHGRAGLSWSMGLDKQNQPNVSAPPPPDQGGE